MNAKKEVIDLNKYTGLRVSKICQPDAHHALLQEASGNFVRWRMRDKVPLGSDTKSRKVPHNLKHFSRFGDVYIVDPRSRSIAVDPMFGSINSVGTGVIARDIFDEINLKPENIIDIYVNNFTLSALFRCGTVLVTYNTQKTHILYGGKSTNIVNSDKNHKRGEGSFRSEKEFFVYNAPKVNGHYPVRIVGNAVFEGGLSLLNDDMSGDIFLLYKNPKTSPTSFDSSAFILSVGQSLRGQKAIPYDSRCAAISHKLIAGCFTQPQGEPNEYIIDYLIKPKDAPIGQDIIGKRFSLPEGEAIHSVKPGENLIVVVSKTGRLYILRGSAKVKNGPSSLSATEINTQEPVTQAVPMSYGFEKTGVLFITRNGKFSIATYESA